MSAIEAPPVPAILARSRGGAIFLAVIAPLGPLLMALSLFAVPSQMSGDIASSAAAITADPVAAQWSVLLITLSAVFGASGALVVGAAIRGGAPFLGAFAASLAFTGYIVAAYQGPVPAISAAGPAGLTEAQTLALITGVDSQLQGVVFSVLFVFLPAGTLLLGIAALVAAHRRRFPWWPAILLTMSIPLVLASGFAESAGVLPEKSLAVSWLILAVAFGAAAWPYVRGFGRTRATDATATTVE